MEIAGKKPLSLYFHIPFCKKKCPYCHFFVIREEEKKKDILVSAFLKELELLHFESYAPPVSIYFGGGTPSLMGPERLHRLLSYIKEKLGPFQSNPEITLEVNPEGITHEIARSFIDAGINRVSLGVQSLDEIALKQIGRAHSVQESIAAIEAFKIAGASQISIDLMYDRPNQTLEGWKKELKLLETLPVDHLSLYNLTIEEGSAYKRHEAKIRALQPSNDLSFELLSEALSSLEAIGFTRYEISAFGRNGATSIHNLGYWQGRDFYGIGPSAFSYIDQKRIQNVASFPHYIKALQEGKKPIHFEEKLEAENSLREMLAIGLRVTRGVELQEFQRQFGRLSVDLSQSISKLTEQGYLQKIQETLQLTAKGQLFYDEVGAELI